MLGIETIPFTAEEIDSLELRKETLVHGWIGPVRRALDRLGIVQPTLDHGPVEEIREFYGRHMWETNMKYVRERLENNHHMFIKPLKSGKAFTGFVTSGAIRDLIKTASFPDEFEILASDVVDFVAEYRLFIHRGLIVNCRHYRGDFTKYPDFEIAQKCVLAFKSAPVAYSLDLGVTSEGKTLVVEVNDAFSLGAYGMPSIAYAQMVIDRWCELTGI